jgi:DNA repair photolyase
LHNVTFMSATPPLPSDPLHGRGARSNPANRFDQITIAPDADYAECDEHGVPIERPAPRTLFFEDASESILTPNDSPDVGANWGLNPYRGCEHGCAYCFARPFHDYLGFSSGLDFETKILVKRRAPELLRAELAARRWRPEPVMISGVTDPYQPAERRFRLTRACLEVFATARHPVGVITKNFLITRDVDLFAELARWRCATVTLSVTTLDAALAGKLEPRASRPEHRLRAIRLLADAGVPVTVNVAPVIPGLTDHELPAILEAARDAGARRANYILLRLPHTVKDLFLEWLDVHAPTKKARVVARLRELRGGQLSDARFGTRGRGEGVFADQLAQLFAVTTRRLGLNREEFPLSTAHFRRPGDAGQLELL